MEMLQRDRPSPVSAILPRALVHPQQPEIIQVSSESNSPSPIPTDDSDGELPIPDPDDSGVVQAVLGNGFQIVDEAPLWTVPKLNSFTWSGAQGVAGYAEAHAYAWWFTSPIP
jgi:hypothetical protein